jgi:tRNA pseudouridine-54 N-methylase
LIDLVTFLILIEKITSFNKKVIDEGNTPLDVYKLCSCLREVFCLSYSIRKENNFYIAINQNLSIIKLTGSSLRYLGPDERSQAILVLKALEIQEAIPYNKWINSTPGILIKKTINLEQFLTSIQEMGEKFFFIDDINSNLRKSTNYTIKHQDVIILDESREKILPLHKLGEFERIHLPKEFSLENKILYINYQLDQQK